MEFIKTPNPNALKIEISHKLEVGTKIHSLSDTEDKLCTLFINTPGVSAVFVGPGFLTNTISTFMFQKEQHPKMVQVLGWQWLHLSYLF